MKVVKFFSKKTNQPLYVNTAHVVAWRSDGNGGCWIELSDRELGVNVLGTLQEVTKELAAADHDFVRVAG